MRLASLLLLGASFFPFFSRQDVSADAYDIKKRLGPEDAPKKSSSSEHFHLIGLADVRLSSV